MKRKIITLFITSFLFSGIILAQTEKKNTHNVGFDRYTQGFYWGFDHHIQNYYFGLDIGSSFGLFYPFDITLCVDNGLYFGHLNKYDHKTWHVNAKLAYRRSLYEPQPHILFMVPSLGKTFYLNKNLGINIELGYDFTLHAGTGLDMPGTPNAISYGNAYSPNLRIELKY